MDESIRIYIVLVVAAISTITTVQGLECYACENQDSNTDKCIKTSIQCEEHQDICFTNVQWGLPPYWTPYGDRWLSNDAMMIKKNNLTGALDDRACVHIHNIYIDI